MKEQVTKFDLEAAFKALDEIGYEKPKGGIKANRVDLKETFTKKLKTDLLVEDYYDVNDGADMDAAKAERDEEIAKAKLARIEKIVDLDAQSPDDLLGSYVGKYIIRCPQCMTLFYKDKADIEESEEDPSTVNVGEACQHCGNTSGYELIGKVGNVEQDELNNYEQAEQNTAEATGEEQPQEEQPAENNNEEAPAENNEENNEANLDEFNLNLDDNQEENKNESLNLSDAQKDAEKNSDLATENESEHKTLNEEVDKDLDEKLKAHNDYIEYLKKAIEEQQAALAATENKEVHEAIQRRLEALEADLQAALPDAVKNNEVEIEETETVEEQPTEEQPAEETNESLTENLNEDKRDDDDYYGKDIDDAVIQLKKKGHAEFWCLNDGKKKADEIVKIVKDKYGKDVEYTITDGYCEAKVVKSKKESIKESLDTDLLNELVDKIPMDIRMDLNVETNPLYGEGQGVIGGILFDFDFNEDTIAKATELANAVISNLDQAKYSYQIWNPNALSTEECQSIDEVVRAATEQNEVDLFDEDGYLQISIYENESAVDESLNNSEAQKDAEEKSELATENGSKNTTLNEAAEDEPKTLGDVEFTEADLDNLMKTELSKPINDAEVEAMLNDDNVNFEADIDDIDEACVESIITESLTKVYNNIRTFKLKECTLDENNHLVLEGLITFNSAKSKKINYTFTEAKKNDNKVILTGVNEALGANSKFVLTGLLENKNLKPQTFSYNYVVNSKLVEGLIQR